jgi:hypothetical protein
MRRLIAVLSLFAFFLFLAPAADATLPSPKSTKLKPGSSFGGVKLGMNGESAVKTWGKGGTCDGVTPIVTATCNWVGSASTGSASLDIRNGKVSGIDLNAGQKSNGECVYKGALPKWKDAKGLGLGSSVPTVARKYKKGFANGSGWQLNSGKRATLWDSSGGRACRISLTYLSILG